MHAAGLTPLARQILACGPPPMIEFAVKANLLKLGYDKDALAVF